MGNLKELTEELNKFKKKYHQHLNSNIDDISFEEFVEKGEKINLKILELTNKINTLNPTYSKISKIGDIYSLSNFTEACLLGNITDYDGFGYFIENDKQTNIIVPIDDIVKGKNNFKYDKLIWFNK